MDSQMYSLVPSHSVIKHCQYTTYVICVYCTGGGLTLQLHTQILELEGTCNCQESGRRPLFPGISQNAMRIGKYVTVAMTWWAS